MASESEVEAAEDAEDMDRDFSGALRRARKLMEEALWVDSDEEEERQPRGRLGRPTKGVVDPAVKRVVVQGQPLPHGVIASGDRKYQGIFSPESTKEPATWGGTLQRLETYLAFCPRWLLILCLLCVLFQNGGSKTGDDEADYGTASASSFPWRLPVFKQLGEVGERMYRTGDAMFVLYVLKPIENGNFSVVTQCFDGESNCYQLGSKLFGFASKAVLLATAGAKMVR